MEDIKIEDCGCNKSHIEAEPEQTTYFYIRMNTTQFSIEDIATLIEYLKATPIEGIKLTSFNFEQY